MFNKELLNSNIFQCIKDIFKLVRRCGKVWKQETDEGVGFETCVTCLAYQPSPAAWEIDFCKHIISPICYGLAYHSSHETRIAVTASEDRTRLIEFYVFLYRINSAILLSCERETMNQHLRTSIVIGAALFLLLFAPTASVDAAMSYGSGIYTNLCGTATSATANTCNKGCNTSTGACSASYVVKWTCDGKTTDCRSNETSFASSQSLGSPGCGKTVQIDVFNKNCRAGGGWTCSDADLQDYIVWYSGDCGGQIPACDSNAVSMAVNPQPAPLGSNVSFSVSGSQGSTWIADSWSGGVSCTGPFWGTKSCNAIASGTYTWTHNWKNCSVSTDNCGGVCTKQINYQIQSGPTPTPTATCDGFSVVSGNNALVPATVVLRARATNATRYRFYFGDGKQEESTSNEITHRYENSGTFTARVDIKDPQDNWRTSSSCEATLTVKSLPIESQKSDCSDLFILEGDNKEAPSTVKASVTGYDNKGNIKKYQVNFGNGIIQESESSTFSYTYANPGTYTISGYIRDSRDNWKGGAGSCQKTISIKTKAIVSQPKTGPSTIFTVIGLGAGLAALCLNLLRRRLS